MEYSHQSTKSSKDKHINISVQILLIEGKAERKRHIRKGYDSTWKDNKIVPYWILMHFYSNNNNNNI